MENLKYLKLIFEKELAFSNKKESELKKNNPTVSLLQNTLLGKKRPQNQFKSGTILTFNDCPSCKALFYILTKGNNFTFHSAIINDSSISFVGYSVPDANNYYSYFDPSFEINDYQILLDDSINPKNKLVDKKVNLDDYHKKIRDINFELRSFIKTRLSYLEEKKYDQDLKDYLQKNNEVEEEHFQPEGYFDDCEL